LQKSKWIFRYFIRFYQKDFYSPTLNATKHSLAVAIRYGSAGLYNSHIFSVDLCDDFFSLCIFLLHRVSQRKH
jgi:hypothetical protein